MAQMRKIRARERLEFVLDVGAAFSPDKAASRDYLVDLVNEAFGDPEDEQLRAVVIESLSRVSHGDSL